MQRGRVRPDPVSCQSCRSKKLKCSRVQPCSNCTARGIACNFLVPPQRRAGSASTFHSDSEILARIERLESIVLKQTGSAEALSNSTLVDSDVTGQQPLYPSPESFIASNVHLKRDQDSLLLENIGTREDSLLSQLSNGLTFQLSSIHEILEIQTRLQQPVSVSKGDRLNNLTVIFPVYRIAASLIQSYESNVDHLCHILHLPTIRSLIKSFYLRITQNEFVLPSQAGLLLSIFAIAAYFYKPSSYSEVATAKEDCIRLSKVLSRGALDVLEYTRRNTSGTLEDVQASILMSFVAYHLDGFSARGRLLATAAASIARELRLHRLDAESELSNVENETNLRSLVDKEVKRRVFWQIVSTDWLLSTISGPQEGMYFIHPNHVGVNLPKNCADEDLVLGDNQPTIGSHPTSMTFFLERLRLAHLCREMTDVVPLETSKLMQMPYEHIVALDEKLQGFISGLPFFYKLDAESRQRSRPIETMFPKIPISRYCITTEAHSRRCKLHQKFLLRQSIDSRYAYSRRACLDSARTVLQVYEDLREHDSLDTAPELMGIAVHFTHLALVVMVMDLCFNKDETGEADIKSEVKAALQMFEESQNASPLLGRFLSSLSEVLQKHKVHLTETSTMTPNDVAGSANQVMLGSANPADGSQMQATELGMDMQDLDVAFDTSLEDFWQSVMHGDPNLDSFTWDNLFSTLDSRPF